MGWGGVGEKKDQRGCRQVSSRRWGWLGWGSYTESFFFFFNFNLFIIYFFLAVLGLRFCARAFSSCDKRGPLFFFFGCVGSSFL